MSGAHQLSPHFYKARFFSINELLEENLELSPTWHTLLWRQLSQFLCKNVMLYAIFTTFLSWSQPCNCWNDGRTEKGGQLVLALGQALPSCLAVTTENLNTLLLQVGGLWFITWPFQTKMYIFVTQTRCDGSGTQLATDYKYFFFTS